MIKRVIFAVALAVLIQVDSRAQVERPERSPVADASEVLRRAALHIQKGEECLFRGDTDCARREFDDAVDEVLRSGIDLRTDEHLLASWREMIEQINRREVATVSADGKRFWRAQEYEGKPLADDAPSGIEQTGPRDSGTFEGRFAELQRRFSEKYGRKLILTGADHAEHRRLYGVGGAYDIRVRDLNREQVKFIIATGSALGLRIKDFSTWERVSAHNARSRMLGRPSDTLATGVHLHIDRVPSQQSEPLTSRPAVSSKIRSGTKR